MHNTGRNRGFNPRGGQKFNRPRKPYYVHTKSEDFWCDTCDRGFRTQDILDKHKSEHQTCGIEGCTFIAHPNVVTKHIQMQHSTGLYSKIKNVQTPEDIARWIAERKKRYPTTDNIEQQKARDAERIDRGEKLEKDKSLFNRRHKRDDRGRHRTNTRHNRIMKKLEQLPTATIEDDDNYCGLAPFKGVSEILRDELIEASVVPECNLDIEDDDDYGKSTGFALTSLMTTYASDDSEPEEVGIVKQTSPQPPVEPIKPEVEPNPKKRKTDERPPINKQPKSAFQRNLNTYKRHKTSLLEKLLEADIRHERNVVLQCINYIVKNNYFE